MIRILFFIFLTPFIFGCDLEGGIRPEGLTFGFFYAKMNSEPWIRMTKKGFQTTRGMIGTSQRAFCPDNYYVIGTDLYNGTDYSVQYLNFTRVPLARGKYKVVPNVYDTCGIANQIYGNFNTMIGGDVLGDGYRILPGEDNFLQVESYNPKSKEIKGSFQLTFVLDRVRSYHTLPDTMRFTDGRFFTKIMDLRRKKL